MNAPTETDLAPPHGANAPRPPRGGGATRRGHPRLLVCDHRGANIDAELGPLEEAGYRLETTTHLRQSLARIEAERPDLILIDPLARGGTTELLTIDHARTESSIPLLIVVEPGDPIDSLAGDGELAGGSWDLVWRGAPSEELLLRIQRLETATQLVSEMQELRHQAIHDDRTDLLRPMAFQERLLEHYSAAKRHGLEIALVLLDLDKFGQFNKRYDHTVGDALISRVGEVIRKALRTEDAAGRLGGDEFAVILPYTKKIDAGQVVHRLQEEIKNLSGFFAEANAELEVSASLGFETYDGKADGNTSLETIRRHAEKALKFAKKRGGNQGVYYRSLSSGDR